MSIAYVFLAVISGAVASYLIGYGIGRLSFGKTASFTPGYTEAEIYGAFEGAILSEFGVTK